MLLIKPRVFNIHCTKKHISQALEYHEKFKNTKKISTSHQLFRPQKDRISYLWKVQNMNFSVLKKLVFHGEENIILYLASTFWIKRISSLASTFWIKRRLYFSCPKSSKQKLLRIEKTWYSMLKKISFYINFLNQNKTVFPISEKFKTRTFP